MEILASAMPANMALVLSTVPDSTNIVLDLAQIRNDKKKTPPNAFLSNTNIKVSFSRGNS